MEDHPRVCGEQNLKYFCYVSIRGSPPRVRGTVHHAAGHRQCEGITPACAGNSKLVHNSAPLEWDHPRVCGEQQEREEIPMPDLGSPPRVRGTAARRARAQAESGITPACAGNSIPHRSFRSPARDHPRVCGEQVRLSAWLRLYRGSPPRVRGTALRALPCGGLKRITPACAGNRLHKVAFFRASGDHPRVCGEQRAPYSFYSCHIGSPPRVRGTEPPQPVGPSHQRITPASAGNRPVSRPDD